MITMMPPSEIPAIPPRCSGVVVRSMRFSFDCASCSYLRCSLGVPADEVRKRIRAFLHQVRGGRDGTGWAVGQSVFMADLYRAIMPDERIGFISTGTVLGPHQHSETGRVDEGELVYVEQDPVSTRFLSQDKGHLDLARTCAVEFAKQSHDIAVARLAGFDPKFRRLRVQLACTHRSSWSLEVDRRRTRRRGSQVPVRVVLASVRAETDGPGAPVMDRSLPLRM